MSGIDYILYYHPICPLSRKVRFLLDEFGVKYEKQKINFWESPKELLKLNPLSTVPVLYDKKNNFPIVGSFIITEYLIEKFENQIDFLRCFLSNDILHRAEIRRIEMLLDINFYNSVSKCYIEEKVYKNYTNDNLNVKLLEQARNNKKIFFKYIETLIIGKQYLVEDNFSIADISLATQISSLDYLGCVEWSKFTTLKEWYLPIKSKIGFRDILEDRIEGISPSKNYTKLDF